MQLARKIVPHCPNGVPSDLSEIAAQFITGGVKLIGFVGTECEEDENIVDEVSVKAGSPKRNFILTSSHPAEPLQDAIEFAEFLDREYEGAVQVVELP